MKISVMNEKTIEQADEEVLNCEVSDDALETAGGAAEGRPQFRPRFQRPRWLSDLLLLI